MERINDTLKRLAGNKNFQEKYQQMRAANFKESLCKVISE